ncbi:agc pdk1 protein kinase [Stylonychia lemnae]|uniref:non-specific serine/threonine protein kinase n=1 Tax=Stylonychia lemnae TaxID=5949 RepID=A0A077ZSD1_STYLE|nr:agc pdk1 protein kinase [Stylonychia lemnae]|eukprot:CDW71361.1 agc pdk1 protein kinase [Stylonychia lemnae]
MPKTRLALSQIQIDFEVIKQIGTGNFTNIYKVLHKKYPENYYALKVCDSQKVSNLRKETDILMEKHALNKILLDCKDKGIKDEDLPCVKLIGTFKDGINLYFLTEALNSKDELWEYCRTFGMFNDSIIRYTFYEICKSVQQLHSIGIIHRDLKPENMFYTNNQSHVKLIDFGSAEDIQNSQIRAMRIDDNPKRHQHLNFVGTPQYMSPECIRNQGSFLASDIWSLGCILYQFYLGLLPFRGKSDYLIFVQSTVAKYRLEEYPDILIPQEAKDLIQKLLIVDHKLRPSIENLLQSPYFDMVRNLKKMPEPSLLDKQLKEICLDFITRGNVYQLEGIDKFDQHFESNVIQKFIKEELWNLYLESQDQIQLRLDHIRMLAKNFIFDTDPYPEDNELVQKLMRNESQYQDQQRQMEQNNQTKEQNSSEDEQDLILASEQYVQSSEREQKEIEE